MDKTTISLRIPVDLVELLDAEATERRRSRAFIVIEKLENNYAAAHNGNGKTTAKARKKVSAAK